MVATTSLSLVSLISPASKSTQQGAATNNSTRRAQWARRRKRSLLFITSFSTSRISSVSQEVSRILAVPFSMFVFSSPPHALQQNTKFESRTFSSKSSVIFFAVNCVRDTTSLMGSTRFHIYTKIISTLVVQLTPPPHIVHRRGTCARHGHRSPNVADVVLPDDVLVVNVDVAVVL